MNTVLPLFDVPVFHGPDVTPQDAVRLETQLSRVEAFMASGMWRRLSDIAFACACSEPSASARLRQLRSMGWQVERKRDADRPGVFWYRCIKEAVN